MSAAPPRGRAVRARAGSLLAELGDHPERFTFDAALRILAADGREVRFATSLDLSYPTSEITRLVEGPGATAVTQLVGGLVGPSGVLPRYYTDQARIAARGGSAGLHAFLDMLAQPPLAAFAAARVKYRLERLADQEPEGLDPVGHILLALAGHASGGTAERVAAGAGALRGYAGLFAMRVRSAVRLQALLTDWFGLPVLVRELVGRWLPIAPDQRSKLGGSLWSGAWARLDGDALLGERSWDPQGRFIVEVGPLDHARFASLMPGRPLLTQMVSLIRAFVGSELDFAVNPVLRAAEVPDLRLGVGTEASARLGWNSWLRTHQPRRQDAVEAVFEAVVVERLGLPPAGSARA